MFFKKKVESQNRCNFFVSYRLVPIFGYVPGYHCPIFWCNFYFKRMFHLRERIILVIATTKIFDSNCMCQNPEWNWEKQSISQCHTNEECSHKHSISAHDLMVFNSATSLTILTVFPLEKTFEAKHIAEFSVYFLSYDSCSGVDFWF